jgi:hypothetical protein
MEQHFFEDEFEQFLRENADQHRMYPSEAVWTNVYRKFHPGKRRLMIAILLLLVLSGMYWLFNTTVIPSSPSKNGIVTAEEISYHDHFPNVTVDDIIAKLRAKSLMPPLAIEAPAALKPLGIRRELRPSLVTIPTLFTANFGYADQFSMSHWDLVLPRLIFPVYDLSSVPFKKAAPAETTTEVAGEPAPEPEAQVVLEAAAIAARETVEQKAVVIADQPEQTQPSLRKESLFNKSTSASSVASLLPFKTTASRKPKWESSIHFVPSVGYRNLFDSKNWITYGNSPLMVSRLNVNQFVDHKPAIGFELGGAIRYRLNKALVIKTGLQLNLTRYSIGAFAHATEKTTVALNPELGIRPDTLVATSNLRNLAGNRPERVHNSYLQVSIPVGAELKLFGDDRLQVNLGGSLQPSYLLNTNQIQLSSDFSNYVSEPSLLRRWNLASSMEVFVTYNTGKVNWQIGPQFRYNLLSTFKKAYPIKENLMEYGLKIGITRPIR